MKRYSLFTILCAIITLFFVSCTKTSNKTISFPISSEYEFMGLVHFDNEPCISFVKKHFKPNIKIFNEQGVMKDSISLVEAEKRIENITDVWMTSPDSIFLYSNYNGILLVIDAVGTLLFEKSYYKIKDKNGYHYDLLPSHPLYPYLPNEFSDVIFSTWMWSGPQPKTPQERLNDVRNGYLMCCINPFHKFNDGDHVLFGVKFSEIEELSVYDDKSIFFAPLYKTFIVNNKRFMTSFYSRFLYELTDTLTVKRKIQIVDNNASLSRPIPMDREGSIQDKANETMAMPLSTQYVVNILYNDTYDQYIILIKNGLSDNIDYVPFKIQYYDEELEQKREVAIEGSNYNPRKSFILGGNLYVEKKSNQYQNEKREFGFIPL